MKKILLGIATFITMAIICVVGAGAETYGDYTYTVLDDGTVEITDYTDGATTIEIPSEIDGKKVTSIGNNAFKSCYSLNSVVIPDGITNIGDYAFYACMTLSSISIPDSVKTIGAYVFYDCQSFTSITIPYGVESIGEYTFSRCFGLKSITLSDSITSIGHHAFYNCTGLTSVIIPENVTSIEEWTFADCKSLSSVIIPDGVTNIGENAFFYCTSLAEITIPDSVTEIGGYAFHTCSKLQSVIIPDSVTSIGKYAFYSCTALTYAGVPDSVTDIGNYSLGYYSFEREFAIVDGFVINCYENSAAYEYAINNGIDYKIYLPLIADFALTSRNYNSITLSWTADASASGYIVEQYVEDNWVQIADITDNATVTYKVTGLIPGTAYKFRMFAYSDENSSRYTAELKVNTLMTAVKDFTSPSKSTSAIRLSWAENKYADGYVIEHYKSGSWVQIADITDSATTTYKVTGLSSGTAYKFRMKAYSVTKYDETIYGNKTATLTANTLAPSVTDLDLKSRSAIALRLTWEENTAVDGYAIEQYIDGKWTEIADVDSYATTEYKVTGLNPATTYKFRMRAYCITKYGDKAYSAYTSTLKKTTAPSVVTELTVKGRAKTAIRLAWEQNTSAKGYIIEQCVDGKWVRVGKVTPNDITNYRIDGLASGTTYKFRVKTYIVTDTSIFSNYAYISGTTL